MKLSINEGTKGFISPNAAAEYYYDYGNYALWPDSIIDDLKEKGYDKDFIDEVFFIMNSMLDDDEAAEEDRYGFDYEDDFEELFDEGCYKNRKRKQLDESVPSALITLKNQLMNKLGNSFVVKGGSLTPKVTVYSEEEPDTTFDITTDGKNVEITPKYNGIADTVHKKKGITFMRAANVLYDFIMNILSGGRKLATEEYKPDNRTQAVMDKLEELGYYGTRAIPFGNSTIMSYSNNYFTDKKQSSGVTVYIDPIDGDVEVQEFVYDVDGEDLTDLCPVKKVRSPQDVVKIDRWAKGIEKAKYKSVKKLKEDSLDDIGFDYKKRYISNVDNQCKFEIVQCLKQLGIRKYDFIDEPQLEFACQLMIESDFETYKRVLACLEQENFYAYR